MSEDGTPYEDIGNQPRGTRGRAEETPRKKPNGQDDQPRSANGLNGHSKKAKERGRKVGRLTLYTDADAADAVPRDYYLKGILSPAEMSVFYGEPGCGKSFLILYIARAISQGREIFGRRVHQTGVLVLALEGIAGFENRLRAEIIERSSSEHFGYIAQPINLFSDNKAVSEVIEAANLMEAGLIVIDTLNRALQGGSENAPEDMGVFIANIDRIRAATGAHVAIIHHSGKDDSRGMRGHSALLGATDVSVKVKKDAETGLRIASLEKAKDDADGVQIAFRLEVVELGRDADKDPITTCIVREEGAAPDKPQTVPGKRLTPTEMRWMTAIHDLFAIDEKVKTLNPGWGGRDVKRTVTRDELREWARTKGLIGVTGNVTYDGPLGANDRKKYERNVDALITKGKMAIYNNYIWLVE